MSENITIALQLLLVGMVTVFFILGLVVLLGRLLISIVNRYASDPPPSGMSREGISKKKLAILSAAVESITEGRGVIQSVKKLD